MRRPTVGALLVLSAAACAVSTQQEVQMGQQYAQQINAQLPIISDPEVQRYINVIGDSIAKLSDERDLDWQFHVVDSREVNAFAVPGGFIYINRGLIERANNLAQLAGVLGHEIAHVTERHSIKQSQKAQTTGFGVLLACTLLRSACANPGTGELINVGGTALFAKFSRDDEAEADAKAIRYVMRAGIDPRGIPEMFRSLLAERRRQPSSVESFFSTHPLEEDRIAVTERMIAQIDKAVLQSLTTNTPNFDAFKRRVQALPPPPARRADAGGR